MSSIEPYTIQPLDCRGVIIEVGDLVQHIHTLHKYRVCNADRPGSIMLLYKGVETGWYPTNNYEVVEKKELPIPPDLSLTKSKTRKLMLTWNAEV